MNKIGMDPRDLSASVVVFLVALPLCMGVAVASGVPPALGLVTGIVGGLVVGTLAGSPLQVSGPAAGLTVLVYDLVETHGIAALGPIVLLAGGMQVVAGLLGVGRWFRAVSPAVIQGMLAGIGVLIFASQIHVMVDDKPKGHGLDNLLTIPGAIARGLFPLEGTSHHFAAWLGAATVIALVVWTKWRPAALKTVPAALVAVGLATAAALALSLPIRYVAIPDHLIGALNVPSLDSFTEGWRTLLGAAVGVAVIASAESLLCASAVDRLHHGPRTNYDRELVAQGVGNVVCGAVGALPLTGVIVRSTANVEAGGRTRWSAVLHGAWLLLLVAALPFVLEWIPTTALAAVLVFTGAKLADPRQAVTLWKQDKVEAGIFVLTAVSIVATDLLVGVGVGVAAALARTLYLTTRLDARVVESPDRIDVYLSGVATFLSIPTLASTLEHLPTDRPVQVHTDAVSMFDPGARDFVDGWVRQHAARGGQVTVALNRAA